MPSMHSYSLTERQRRWDLTRRFMIDQGLDAMIIYGEHEDAGAAPYAFDNWLTNDRPGSTVAFPRDGEPLELVPFMNFFADHMEGLENGDAIWIAAQNIRAGRDSKTLADVIVELNLEESNIGVLGLEPAIPWHPEGLMPFTLWDKIQLGFPRATFKPVGHNFIPLLLPLSEEELAIVRHAANIGEDMTKAMVQKVQVGVAENEVYAAGMAIALSKSAIVPWMHMNSGPNAVLWGPPRWAWRAQPPRILRSGDLVASEVFCNYGMRQTQHQLTVAIGPLSEDVEKAAKVARACYDAGLNALRPNARFGDLAAAMLHPIEQAGGWVKGPQVHSLNPLAAVCGFSAPSHLITERYPDVRGMPTICADLLLVPGMVFAFEPSCGFGRQAVTLGGMVVLGKEGPIELNPFTAQLHHVT